MKHWTYYLPIKDNSDGAHEITRAALAEAAEHQETLSETITETKTELERLEIAHYEQEHKITELAQQHYSDAEIKVAKFEALSKVEVIQ